METNKKVNSKKRSVFSVDLAAYKLPLFRDIAYNSKNWINFGKDNLFPVYLVDLFNQSAVHNAIVTGKVKYITGRGLALKSEANSATISFVDKPNPYENLDSIFRKMTLDNEIHGGFVLKVVRSRFTKKVVEVYHEDWTKFRRDKNNKERILHSEEWESKSSSVSARKANHNPKIKSYPLYNPKKNDKVSYIYYSEYRPDMHYYPYPEYVGAIPQIETTIEIASFDLNSVKNGFSGGTIINLMNGIPDDDQAEEVEKDLNEKFTGSANGGRVVVNFSEDREHASSIEQINSNDLAERYTNLEDRVKESIFIGHKVVSPMLFGVRTEGQIGGRRELLEMYELFKETYAIGKQSTLLGVLNNLLQSAGGSPDLMVSELKPINPRLPLSDEEVSALISPEAKKKYLATTYGVETVDNIKVEPDTTV